MTNTASSTPAGAAPKKPSPLIYALATAVVVLFIALVYLGLKGKDYLVGAKVGESCTKNEDCASGSLLSTPICIADRSSSGGYCSKECAADSDCPSGLSCIELEGVVLARGNKACGRAQ